MDIKHSRHNFLQTASAAGVAAAAGKVGTAAAHSNPDQGARRFHCVQIDVFTSHRLEGNPIAVYTDARGLSDLEMQGLARETNLQETTFVFPRDPATEQEHGVKVRIFVPDEGIPFGGYPTLGTAMVLRNLPMARANSRATDCSSVVLDLKVGKVPVDFREETSGNAFGEMHQVEPVFGPVHDRDTIAALLDLSPSDISSDVPIQSLSTGLFLTIVPIKNLSTLQRLTVAPRKRMTTSAAKSYLDFLIFITSREILATPRLVCAHEGSSPPAKTPLLGLPPDVRRLGWFDME